MKKPWTFPILTQSITDDEQGCMVKNQRNPVKYWDTRKPKPYQITDESGGNVSTDNLEKWPKSEVPGSANNLSVNESSIRLNYFEILCSLLSILIMVVFIWKWLSCCFATILLIEYDEQYFMPNKYSKLLLSFSFPWPLPLMRSL